MEIFAAVVFATAPGAAALAATLSAQDQKFLEQAAVGGLAEVQEGQLALSQGKNDAVKQFGQQMIADHTPNNQELISIAQQKGIAPPAKLDPKHAEEAAKLEKQTGSAFDKAYITGQVMGHQQMEALMTSEISDGKDPDLKAFAQKTLPVVQEHLKMAQQLEGKS